MKAKGCEEIDKLKKAMKDLLETARATKDGIVVVHSRIREPMENFNRIGTSFLYTYALIGCGVAIFATFLKNSDIECIKKVRSYVHVEEETELDVVGTEVEVTEEELHFFVVRGSL